MSISEDEGGLTYGSDARQIRTELPQGTYGSIFGADFLKVVKPLYDAHMGTENMAPLLYSLVRFTKPRHVLEIGAGYTSVFLLQALKDNAEELEHFEKLEKGGKCVIPINSKESVPQCVPHEVSRPAGMLHTVDNLSHPGQTASKVQEAAKILGSEQHLKLHVKDAWSFAEEMDSEIVLDMIWLDFGAGERMGEFLDKWWPRLNPKGGLLYIHSSLTNAKTRRFLVPYQSTEDSDEKGRLGEYNLFGMLEPHKQYQNSFSVFQKRTGDPEKGYYSEPMYSMGP